MRNYDGYSNCDLVYRVRERERERERERRERESKNHCRGWTHVV